VALHTAGSLETEKSSCKATQTKPGVRWGDTLLQKITRIPSG
jgi:hypothetical protein